MVTGVLPTYAVFAAFNPSRCSTVSRITNFWIFPVIAAYSVPLPLNGFRLVQSLFLHPATGADDAAPTGATVPAK